MSRMLGSNSGSNFVFVDLLVNSVKPTETIKGNTGESKKTKKFSREIVFLGCYFPSNVPF